MDNSEFDELGPIDYAVVEFPAGQDPDGSALPILIDLVERGIIRVLDLVFVRKGEDGSVVGLAIEDFGFGAEVDITLFAEASSGLLDRSDLDEAAVALEPGRSGAILVYENSWAAPFATALRRQGAQLVASGRVPVQGVLSALDALDATS
ncbi:DUF6325 family protein [Rhodococcus sp. PAM 2766]|uniref:DUF6325 family protein n=1 Tax=Rhodococcus parequi TaxID=3137122 RepID=A0ABW9FEW3_9NOCA